MGESLPWLKFHQRKYTKICKLINLDLIMVGVSENKTVPF